ncbi:hypothetical protein GALL_406260 [mine drainage metagenome]|uniref:Uncharacterized protein n=1 Tax=mine drainage metagenome TaxID=410659 RepID=A0A1J5Q1T4_9ZZZZ
MTSIPEPDDVALAARALEGPLEPPNEEVLEAVREGLDRVPVPPPSPFFGIPRQWTRPRRLRAPLRRRGTP